MTKFKITQVTSLPQISEVGMLYVLSSGEIHLGRSNGDFLKLGGSESNVEFVNEIPTDNINHEKLYVHVGTDDTKLLLHNGTDFVDLTDRGQIQIEDVNGLVTSLGYKADSTLVTNLYNKVDSNTDEINNLKLEIDSILTQEDLDNLIINADKVTDTSNRVLLSPAQRSQIEANQLDIQSFGQRLATLENNSPTNTSTDEQVKMDENDTSGYLNEKLDGNTIQNLNNKLVVTGVSGLVSTIEELNLLQGATENIQAQIDALTKIGNFTTSVSTYADLLLIPDAIPNDMVIVLDDETQLGSPSTIYIYNGFSWNYTGKFESGQVRDFTTNPIDLVTESINILPKSRYEKQNASETPFSDASGEITASNVQEAIKQVFQYSDNIRKSWSSKIGGSLLPTDKLSEQLIKYDGLMENITNAITSKGVVAYPYNKLSEIPSKILAIPNVSVATGIKRIDKFTVTTVPYTKEIELNTPFQLKDIVATLFEFEDGAVNQTHYNATFDKTETTKFIPNDDVLLDGTATLNPKTSLTMIVDDNWIDEGVLYRGRVVKDNWNSISLINIAKERS